MNISEQIKSKFANTEDLMRLTKAMENTSNMDAMTVVDYDQELQKKVAHRSPFLRYCETENIVTGASTYKVGYREKDQKTTSEFIAETASIPEHREAEFNAKVATMKTLVYPIEISDLAKTSIDLKDLLEEEITDGFMDIAQSKDKALLQGKGGEGALDFEGLFPSVKTNVEKVDDVLTLHDIDVMAQAAIDAGGSPSAIITTPSIGRQMNSMITDRMRYLDQEEFVLGHNVTMYRAPNGARLPIIVDPNIDTTEGGEKLAIIDNDSLRVRELLPPTMLELAKNKLSDSRVLFTWFTFYNRAEYKNAVLTDVVSDLETDDSP